MGAGSFLHKGLWRELIAEARKGGRFLVAVAYVGKGASLTLPLKENDVLVVNASEANVKDGATNPYELEQFRRKLVRVYHCANLHAKVYVVGKKAFIGSNNLSLASQGSLVEAGVVLNKKQDVDACRRFVESLALEELHAPSLRRLKEIYGTRERRQLAPGKSTAPEFTHLWFAPGVEVHEDEPHRVGAMRREAAKKIRDPKRYEPVWFEVPASSPISRNAREGQAIVTVLRDGQRNDVYPPARILKKGRAKRDETGHLVRDFMIEESNDPDVLRWGEFKRRIAGSSVARLSLKSPHKRISNPKQNRDLRAAWR